MDSDLSTSPFWRVCRNQCFQLAILMMLMLSLHSTVVLLALTIGSNALVEKYCGLQLPHNLTVRTLWQTCNCSHCWSSDASEVALASQYLYLAGSALVGLGTVSMYAYVPIFKFNKPVAASVFFSVVFAVATVCTGVSVYLYDYHVSPYHDTSTNTTRSGYMALTTQTPDVSSYAPAHHVPGWPHDTFVASFACVLVVSALSVLLVGVARENRRILHGSMSVAITLAPPRTQRKEYDAI